MILSSTTIKQRGIIFPHTRRIAFPEAIISSGESLAGYDIRLGYNICVPPGVSIVIDHASRTLRLLKDVAPIDIDPGAKYFVLHCGSVLDVIHHEISVVSQWRKINIGNADKKYNILLGSNCFFLGESLEEITVPRDVIGFCVGKSTYARFGVLVNVTPLEPGWHGVLTIGIANVSATSNVIIHTGHGIAQLVFACVDSETDGYNGKWQNQKGATVVPSGD